MLPYQAVAMDYAGYQRQGVPGGHMSMGMSAAPFGHSWLVPTQDICGVPYKTNQPSGMQTQPLEPGIIELRKEKSRDAARSRRNKENLEFYELAKMLPLPAAITSQLDKASIIRLSISYLKLRHFSGHGNPPWAREHGGCSKVLKNPSMRRSHHIDNIEQHQGTNILQALDGFALAVAADGRFLYISETVSIYLGLSQVELTGSSIFDYIHQQDHEEIADALGLKLTSSQNGSSSTGIASPSSGGSEEGQGGSHGTNNPDVAASMVFHPEKGYERSFAIRMKSTLTKRGVHFKSSGFRGTEDISKSNGRGGKQTTSNNYALVLIQCRLRPQLSFSHTNKSQAPLLGMVGIAVVPPPPSIHEIRLESDMFVTRINFDFKIAHCEPRVTDLLDYLPEELVGKSLYNLCHGEDSAGLRKAHSDLINKGQSQTNYFRIMNKDGGFTWMQTIATVVCSLKNAEEQSIICINYVLSNREDSNLILDCCQLETKIDDIKNEDLKPDNSSGSPNGDPTAEGLPGPQGPIAEPQLISPKQENEPRSRRARTNNNNNIMQLAKDAKRDDIISPSATPTQKRGQKRKLKSDQEDLSTLEPPKSSPSLLDRTRHPGLDDHPESSVKDLENAMSKHLPSPGGSATTDFSTDALLKQQQEKSSTIQWIGTPHYQQPGMPATALLRQLYANRESVIRATARQTPTGGVFYSDGQNGPLPTPPGSESSFDNQFLQLHSHGQKNSDAFTNLVSTYSGYHTSLDYHNAMTPPSSVSPRESGNTLTTMKNASQNPPPTSSYDYGDPLRSQYVSPNQTIDVTGTNTTPALPLKPQPYSVAAMHHPDPSATYSNLEQSQYFSPHHSSFHLYHKGTSAVAPPPTSSGWYSTPS